MKRKDIVIPIFSIPLMIVIGDKETDITEQPEYKDVEWFAGSVQASAYRHDRQLGIFIKADHVSPEKGSYLGGLVAHECLHTVGHIYECIRETKGFETDELSAYFLEFLVEEVLTFCQEWVNEQ